ncbi:MAG: radical SAM protein [Akkermansia muciniphila]
MSTIKHQVASTEEQPVLLIDLLVSCSCNLNCRYCYETHKSPRMMEIETAKTVLRNRFAAEAERGKYSRLEISFFGGEPLLNFGLIREISEWMWAQKWPMDYVLCITTNGTLLNDSMRSWLSANKHRIDVSLSLDGLGRMQELNRTTLPVDVNFFVHNWPHRAVTMVLFSDTIGLFAETVSEMLDAGIDINVAIGGGFRWTKEQAIVYEQQLEKLIPYFIHDVSSARRSGIFSNPEHYYEPIPDVLPMCDEESTKKNSYDADGQLYRCHMFMPIVVGRDKSDTLKKLLCNQNTFKVDARCRNCPIFSCCRMCPAMNMKLWGSVDRNASCDTNCIMMKIQARQSAILHLKFYFKLREQGWDFTESEKIIIKKSLRVLDDIAPAADL